ncbi:MAG: DUF2252 family protein [Candidatus Sericytochromatia bacterium]|nr:DUF2252 family protein [Candidatus Sericytochromatia bacterium]
MLSPCLAAFAALAVVTSLAAPAPKAATAAPTLAYERDAALFLKQHHARAARTPGLFLARKYAAMSDSAVGFFRGSAPLFYRDLAEHPALSSPVVIPISGDLHLENMSAFRNSQGIYTFDLDDFDEAVDAPYTWELVRLLISLRLHAREANLSGAASDRLARRLLKGYVERLAALAADPAPLARPVAAREVPGPAAQAIAAATRGKRAAFLARFSEHGRLRTGKKVVTLDPSTSRGVTQALEAYALRRPEPVGFFKVKDVARRMAGLASLSRHRYLALVEGPGPGDADDVLLDLKEAGPPAAGPWVKATGRSDGERVKRAWDRFVPNADRFLGVVSAGGGSLVVRELTPWHGEVAVDELKTEARFSRYIDAAALVTARAHARSGRVPAILADAGTPDALFKRLATFSDSYARQVESDREIWRTYMDP